MNESFQGICWFPLSQGKWTQVDLANPKLVEAAKYKWTLRGNKGKHYAYRNGGERLHHLLTTPDVGLESDHINGDGLDNRECNLRVCSHLQNGYNISKRKTKTSSKYKGVSRRFNRWRAYISPNGKQIHLGWFETPELAAKAYDEKATEIFGKFARTNFPPRN